LDREQAGAWAIAQDIMRLDSCTLDRALVLAGDSALEEASAGDWGADLVSAAAGALGIRNTAASGIILMPL
jgi:hypothetical protein